MFGTAGHRILQRARSLRRVRPEERHHNMHQAPAPPSHAREMSISSRDSGSRASSSSGPDSPGRRENSVEWDSLRLHPSMELDQSPHITPLYHHAPPRHHNHDGRHPEHDHEFHRPRHQPVFALEIHDGFDFGFAGGNSKPHAAAESSSGSAARRLRAPKSEADLHHRHRRQHDADSDVDAEVHAAQLPPSPTRRPPGFGEADYFIKRGGWKRRGIIFGGGESATHESEDELFL